MFYERGVRVFVPCRLVEFNSRLVCGLGMGEFNDLVTSWNPHADEPCRIVVLRDATVDSDSLSRDISHWSVNHSHGLNTLVIRSIVLFIDFTLQGGRKNWHHIFVRLNFTKY